MTNCVEIVKPFVEALGEREDVQLLGGIGSVALNHPDTVIVPDEKRIIAPTDLNLPQYRNDGNLRDFDVLVLSSQPQLVGDIQAIGQETIDNQLELSVFDLKPASLMDRMKQAPLRHLHQFVSDRYVTESPTGEVTALHRTLFPFSLQADLGTLETWRLFIGDKDKLPAPVPHPGTVILNYLTRSISGLRPKDEEKVFKLADNVFKKMPDIDDWIHDGPGQSQLDFARVLQRVSRPGVLAVGESLQVRPVNGHVSEHPASMVYDAALPTKMVVMSTTYAKARALRQFESNGTIVTIWQRYAESAAGKIVHNE